jgi:hypothetical protein
MEQCDSTLVHARGCATKTQHELHGTRRRAAWQVNPLFLVYGLYNDALSIENIASDVEFKWKCSRSSCGLADVIPRRLLGGTVDNHKKPQLPDVPTAIRTDHLLDTRLERYI